MRLLLDTHTLLWWLNDDERLGPQARTLIADPVNTVLISIASLWEIVIKVRIGKLEGDVADIATVIKQQGFTLIGIDPIHLTALDNLPRHPDHRDPFDHLLIAQTISEGATFVSEDGNVGRYPVRFVTCSDTPVQN